jgi:hypothetical protein
MWRFALGDFGKHDHARKYSSGVTDTIGKPAVRLEHSGCSFPAPVALNYGGTAWNRQSTWPMARILLSM